MEREREGWREERKRGKGVEREREGWREREGGWIEEREGERERWREKGKNVHWKHNSDHAELLRETTVSAKEEEGRKLEKEGWREGRGNTPRTKSVVTSLQQ